MNKEVIIIGSGLAGCTSARILAENGYKVTIYEKNNHIGGNLYDFYDEKGVLIHKYGPHIFHTSYEDVWKFVNRFSKFNGYINKVLVSVDNKLLQMPINLNSLEELFGEKASILIQDINENLDNVTSISISNLMKQVKNEVSKQMLQYIFDNVYANYTSKMWGIKIQDIDPTIIERVKINLDRNWNYFPQDKYQGLPINSYTEMLTNMLNHENIKIILNKDISNEIEIKDNKLLFNGSEKLIIYTGEVDRLFNYKYGELEYRSLNIVFESFDIDSYQDAAVVNYPSDPKMTRISEYKKMTLQNIKGKTTISKEYPGAYGKNSKEFNTPFYPINNEKNVNIVNEYFKEAKKYKNLILLGRLAQYKYFDMDDIIFNCFEVLKKIF